MREHLQYLRFINKKRNAEAKGQNVTSMSEEGKHAKMSKSKIVL